MTDSDFFRYNFPPYDHLPDHLPRPALEEGEATRLIIMKIHVTKIEPPGPEDGQSLPVVYFEGFSRSQDPSWDENANSDLRGEFTVNGTCCCDYDMVYTLVRNITGADCLVSTCIGSVRLTREGEVRWTSFSLIGGQERWRSEGIQLGGIRSCKVVGNWFDKYAPLAAFTISYYYLTISANPH